MVSRGVTSSRRYRAARSQAHLSDHGSSRQHLARTRSRAWADDDGSGTTAVMIGGRSAEELQVRLHAAVRYLHREERGLCGSSRYASEARGRNEDIKGVLNLDMIAYDGDGVRTWEIHAGTRRTRERSRIC